MRSDFSLKILLTRFEITTSALECDRCAGYLLDHSGDEINIKILLWNVHLEYILVLHLEVVNTVVSRDSSVVHSRPSELQYG